MNQVSATAFRRWTPAAQDKALNRLRERVDNNWRPFYCPDPACDGKPHGDWEWNHARADQRPPTDKDWLTWLLQSGRGTGKTRTGSEYTHRVTKKIGRVGIIGGTATDIREVLLEGESGILTIAPPDHRPEYEPSKKRLTWPNGAIGTLFSAEEPDRLRGPEHGFVWMDEPAHWPLVQECWDNMLFGLRIGSRPHIVCTTTPVTRPWLKELRKDPTTRMVSVSTYENIDNLSPIYAQRIIARYEGTRLGRQELHGEMLEDVEGALWNWDLIERNRVEETPARFDRVIVAVDPAGRAKPKPGSIRKPDETGIIAAGRVGDTYYILRDRSARYTPDGWARAAIALHDELNADAIVGETNFGADMVGTTLRNADFDGRFIEQTSTRGKDVRAEPILGLYEQDRVHHTQRFEDLEEELTTWVPGDSTESPNRLDALVFAVAEMSKNRGRATIASPTNLKRPTGNVVSLAERMRAS